MDDLKRIEKRFHEFLGPRLEYLDNRELTGDLFERAETVRVPFGFLKYSLIIRDKRPVLKVHILSRMDTNMMYYISEDSIESRDWFR